MTIITHNEYTVLLNAQGNKYFDSENLVLRFTCVYSHEVITRVNVQVQLGHRAT